MNFKEQDIIELNKLKEKAQKLQRLSELSDKKAEAENKKRIKNIIKKIHKFLLQTDELSTVFAAWEFCPYFYLDKEWKDGYLDYNIKFNKEKHFIHFESYLLKYCITLGFAEDDVLCLHYHDDSGVHFYFYTNKPDSLNSMFIENLYKIDRFIDIIQKWIDKHSFIAMINEYLENRIHDLKHEK